jgi:DNA-binding transcriptional LysR family regulator
MANPEEPTLDQILMFLAIVDEGSFARAARRLRRAPSVVSYTVTNLEAKLGLTLFDREATRKPLLTDAGRAVLADMRSVAMGLDNLLAKARNLTAGVEAELVLAVDEMLPIAPLAEILRAFLGEYPAVALRLSTEPLGGAAQLVLDRTANLALSGPHFRETDELVRRAIGGIELVPVAAPSHPLSAYDRQVPDAVAREHIQLVLTDSSPMRVKEDFGVVAVRTWRLTDLNAKRALLLAGAGWGSMPAHAVRDDLAAGRLVKLRMDQWESGVYRLWTLHRADTPQGPAARWLLDRIRTSAWSD